ncbi:hypothetical protein COOONC_13726, partial [Cooperia oncophora]
MTANYAWLWGEEVAVVFFQRGNYARQLHDTFYMFGSGLSREPTYYHDATNLTKAMAVDFSGLTGEVEMTENNTRVADFMLYYLDTNFQQHIFMKITYKDAKMGKAPCKRAIDERVEDRSPSDYCDIR